MALPLRHRTDEAVPEARRHLAEALAASLPPLQVAAEQVAATVMQGVHGRRRVGQGETFWQYRPYAIGDQPSRIDWRRSARGDRVYVRETEWEAAQSVWLWRDASPSMGYRSAAHLPTKRDHADLLTMALMAMLVRGGERIALLGAADPPATGRAALNRLSATIAITADQDGDGLPVQALLPRHASLILFGDFLSPIDEIDRAIRAFGDRGVGGHLVQILDPAEVTMPFTGRSRFTGLEAEGDLLVGRAESLRNNYLARLDTHQMQLRDLTRNTGWSFVVHHTNRPVEPALLGLYGLLSNQPEI